MAEWYEGNVKRRSWGISCWLRRDEGEVLNR